MPRPWVVIAGLCRLVTNVVPSMRSFMTSALSNYNPTDEEKRLLEVSINAGCSSAILGIAKQAAAGVATLMSHRCLGPVLAGPAPADRMQNSWYILSADTAGPRELCRFCSTTCSPCAVTPKLPGIVLCKGYCLAR